jgi:hypothetical protein
MFDEQPPWNSFVTYVVPTQAEARPAGGFPFTYADHQLCLVLSQQFLFNSLLRRPGVSGGVEPLHHYQGVLLLALQSCSSL